MEPPGSAERMLGFCKKMTLHYKNNDNIIIVANYTSLISMFILEWFSRFSISDLLQRSPYILVAAQSIHAPTLSYSSIHFWKTY
jgi:hypothetical protein